MASNNLQQSPTVGASQPATPRSRWARSLVTALALCAASSALIVTPWRAGAETPAAAEDYVVLKNGTKYSGRITRQEPGKFVIIETKDATRTVMWEDLREIVARPAPVAPSAVPSTASPPPKPTASATTPPTTPTASAKTEPTTSPAPKASASSDGTTTVVTPPKEGKKKTSASTDVPTKKGKATARSAARDDEEDDDVDEAPKKKKPKQPRGDRRGASANADGSGVKAGLTHECAEDDQACKEELKASVGKGGAKATYKKEEDCSDEDDDNCTATTSAEGGTGGVGISYTRESVKAVDKPTNSAGNFALALGIVGGAGTNISMFGSSSSLSYRGMVGSRFPDRKGGSWFGVFFEPFANISYLSMSMKVPQTCYSSPFGGQQCAGGGTSSSSSGMLQFGSSVGLQWVSFGKMDEKSRKQHGFGLGLGAQLGGSMFLSSGGGGSTDLSFSYGPVLSLIFPTFNPSTASYSMFQVNFLILPMKDFVLFTGGVQWGFG